MKYMSKKVLDSKVEELQELQSQIEELTARAEMIKDEIKAFMKEKEELITENYKIHYTYVDSTRFDSKALKSSRPDIYDEYLTKTSYRRFSIT